MFRKITLALNFLYLAPANLLLVYMIFLWFFPSVPILFILLVLTIALSTLLPILHILKDKKNKVWIIILNSLMLIFSLGWFGVIVEDLFTGLNYINENPVALIFVLLLPTSICNIVYVTKYDRVG